MNNSRKPSRFSLSRLLYRLLGLSSAPDSIATYHARGFVIFWLTLLSAFFVEQIGLVNCGALRNLILPVAGLLLLWALADWSRFWLVWWSVFLSICMMATLAGLRCEDIEPFVPIWILFGFSWASWNLAKGPSRPMAVIAVIYVIAYLLAFLIWAELNLLERFLYLVIVLVGGPAVLAVELLSRAFDEYRQQAEAYV